MKEYAVYIEREVEVDDGFLDNDLMDWFDRWEDAFKFAMEKVELHPGGEAVHIAEVMDCDFTDFTLQLVMENGIIHQYRNGERLWMESIA